MTTNTLSDRPSVPLCCEPGLHLRGTRCYADDSFPAENIMLPEIYRSDLSISSMSPEEFVPRYDGTHCLINALYSLHPDSAENVLIYLLENGTICVNDSANGDHAFATEKYCLASQMTGNGTKSVVSVCLQVHYISDLRNLIINVILPSLSVPFFLAMFIIYTILPEVRSIQRYVFLSYIAALFVSYLSDIEIGTDCTCRYAMRLTLQFSTLATFFWLNVMSFDIWRTFTSLGSQQRNTSQQYKKKIIIYSFYAWGASALITGIGIIMDFLPVELTNLIRPGLRENCMFTTRAATMIYITGPLAGTTIFNVFFFSWTVIKIIRQKRDTAKHLGGTDSRRHDDKSRERFNLYLKLFIVMGISRSASIIAWAYNELPDFIWYSLAVEGCLQGPIIFVVYVWKEDTKQLLINRLLSLNKIFRRTNSGNTAEQSRSDTGATTTTVVVTCQDITCGCCGHEKPNSDENNA